ncbi:DegT/DnrJ/EryC1/StrS family aminotransferase [Shewanella gaetbuli]
MSIKLNQPLKPNVKELSKYLNQVNESGWYTNFGPLHQLFTSRLERFLGVENLLLVSNGTLALQIAYKTLNVRSSLTTPFSFVATASSLIWQNIDTAFSDIDRNTYNLCPKAAQEALEEDDSIDTVLATHVYGNPCDVDELENLSINRNVNIIYDAAHAFGVKVNGKSVLSYGDASTLSFHATKVFHTVEGGAIVFKCKADFERAKRLINFGLNEVNEVTEVGINAKMNEYQCAVGLTLLDKMDEVLTHRASLFTIYRERLEEVVEFPQWQEDASFNGAYMPVRFKNARDKALIEKTLCEHSVQFRQYFSPSLDNMFENTRVFSNTNCKEISNTILCLPLHYYMKKDDVLTVSNLIKKALI